MSSSTNLAKSNYQKMEIFGKLTNPIKYTNIQFTVFFRAFQFLTHEKETVLISNKTFSNAKHKILTYDFQCHKKNAYNIHHVLGAAT